MSKPTKQNDVTPLVPAAPFAAAPIEVEAGAHGEVHVDKRAPKEASFHIVPVGPNEYDVVLKVGGKVKHIERAQPINMCSKAVIANAAHLALWAQGVRELETGDVG